MIERDLAPGQVHAYTVDLAAGQFVEAIVDQQRIRVDLDVFGPDGTKLPYSPAIAWAEGPEQVIFIAERPGTYRLEISVGKRSVASGRYVLAVERVDLAAERELSLIEALRLESQVRTTHGDVTRLVSTLERVLSMRERALGPDHPSVAWSFFNLALVHPFVAGRGDTTAYERALSVLTKSLGSDHDSLVRPLSSFASACVMSGDVAKAIGLVERALAIQEKHRGPDHESLAGTLEMLGQLHDRTGDMKRSDVAFRRAIAICEKSYGTEDARVGEMLAQWGMVIGQRGEFQEAEAVPVLERALVILDKTPGADRTVSRSAVSLLANIYSRRGDSAKADALRARLNDAAPKTSIEADRLAQFSLLQQALELWENGELRDAKVVLEKMVAASNPDSAGALFYSPREVAQTVLAAVCRALGEYAFAEEIMAQIVTRAESGFREVNLPIDLSQYALLCRAKGDVASAIAYQTRANDLRERRDLRFLTSGSARLKLAQLSRLRSVELDFSLSLHIQDAPANPAASRLALESILRIKGRALDAMADSIGLLRRRASADDQMLLDRLLEAETTLAAAMLKVRTGQDRATLDSLEDRVEDLEAQVSSRSAELRAAFEPVTLDAVQKAVPASAAIIEFAAYQPVDPRAARPSAFYGPSRYAAYVLVGTGTPRVADLGPTATIDAAIERFRMALQDPTRTNAASVAREVDELVMHPVRKLLGMERHLLVAPDGQLNLVPFAALVGENGRYLVEDYSITYLTSGRDLLRPLANDGGNSAPVVIADPDFGRAVATSRGQREITHEGAGIEGGVFAPLPGTAGEAQAVGSTLKGAKVLTRGGATEAAVKRLSRPRVLHVATHGFFLEGAEAPVADARTMMAELLPDTGEPPANVENPLLRSGLALAGANARRSGAEDGILTAMEVAGLNLWGTELVVLSACKTGVGEVRVGEGVYGLRRALVLAGSESQVMTLWSVSDRATRDLMVAFYRRLMAGEGRTEALRQAQLEMLHSRNRSHPYFWAGVIQSGRWGPLDKP